MPQTLPGALGALRILIDSLTGISAPAILPDTLGPQDFPVAVVYPDTGEYTPGNLSKGLHNVVVDIHFSTLMSGAAIDTVAAYPELIGDALAVDPTLGDNVAAVVFPMTYQVAELKYAGATNFGMRLRVRIKTHQ